MSIHYDSHSIQPGAGIRATRGERAKYTISSSDAPELLAAARQMASARRVPEALDLYERLIEIYPQIGIEVLAEVYNVYKLLPEDRYSLYQARHFDFGISSGDKVLDVGSGHHPFPLATHLAEFAINDDSYGRAGIPFKVVEGKPVTECSVEKMPFGDKEFDFVYCSHVLEHVGSPENACRELMRVAKAGFLETPNRGKDLFLNTARISNHRWKVEYEIGRLIFTEYREAEIDGLSCGLLMDMNVNPQTAREQAFSALMLLKSDQLNTMLMWEERFSFEVRRLDGSIFLQL
ncbi:MAG: class I SAM-dependent methyltransferase [Deltaproteobacteria bacterium]|nr:class I SAM-dependent methyltransferase [Deltaproteobacteria bacterium]